MFRSAITRILGLLCLASSASLLTGCDRGDRVQLVIQAQSGKPSEEVMERAREVIDRRLGDLGSPGAGVTRQGSERIVVTLRRLEDVEPVKALVGRSARLEFRLLNMFADPQQIRAGRAPIGTEILAMAGRPEEKLPVLRRPIVTGSMITDAQTGFDIAGQPSVVLMLDAAGTRRFAQATRANVHRVIAIVIDGTVVSAPMIDEPILGGQLQIAGTFTKEEANRLAIALRSGPLPIDLAVTEERVLAR
jgi:preprotein translocase subunit SecD